MSKIEQGHLEETKNIGDEIVGLVVVWNKLHQGKRERRVHGPAPDSDAERTCCNILVMGRFLKMSVDGKVLIGTLSQEVRLQYLNIHGDEKTGFLVGNSSIRRAVKM